VSANVSGFAGTLRISLNDNLLKRCTLPEIETTMGHEMGHYILNHAYKGLVMFGVVIVMGFAFLNWGVHFGLARWGEKWEVRGITDVAVLPLAVIAFSFFFFLMTPVTNTITRTQEYEADMYGLNAARQPDGEANVDMLLGEYRKLDPGPVEEFVFYDPLVGTRASPPLCAGRPSIQSLPRQKRWQENLQREVTTGPQLVSPIRI
jgi:STE24 endopeptidase